MAATRQAGPASRRSPRPQVAGSVAVEPQSAGAGPALLAIKAAHTLVWFSIESCMVYMLYAELANRTNRRAAIAAAVIAAESLVWSAGSKRQFTAHKAAPGVRLVPGVGPAMMIRRQRTAAPPHPPPARTRARTEPPHKPVRPGYAAPAAPASRRPAAPGIFTPSRRPPRHPGLVLE
jgi:hypothetical protein